MFSMPKEGLKIIDTLEKNGFSAYFVGGCVRDMLMGLTPDDWDIATSAQPEAVKRLFPKTFDTGILHGTVTVLADNIPFEVTTYRIDGAYEKNRKPLSVAFTEDIKEDLSRRDFTINAMAYNKKIGLIDPFGGQKDLQNKIIRTVGNACTRFEEDALRMLRAVRFHAKTAFDLDKSLIDAIKKNAYLIQNISIERIREEFDKILLSDNVFSIAILYRTGLLRYFLPELCLCFETEQNIKYHLYDVGTHTLNVVNNVPKTLILRYSALLHDLGKPAKKTTDEQGVDHFKGHGEISVALSADILRRFKMDNKSTHQILRLVKYHDREILASKKAVKRCILAIGEDIFLPLLDLKRGDALGQNLALTKPRLAHYLDLARIYYESKAENEAFSLADLAVNGNHIKALGFDGIEVGKLLRHLLLHVLEFPCDNKKEILTDLVEKKHKLWLDR